MNLKDIENANKFFKEGNKQYDLDNLSAALKEYSKSVYLNPNNLDAFFNRGCVKRDLKDYQGAISDFSKIIEISPQNTTAIFNRGIIKLEKNVGANVTKCRHFRRHYHQNPCKY